MPVRILPEEVRLRIESDIAGTARDICHGIMRRQYGMPSGLLISIAGDAFRTEAVPMPRDFQTRQAIAEAVRRMLLADHATAYAVGLEMWTRTVGKEDLNKPQGDFGKAPDREESVIIQGQTKDGNFCHRFDIVRSETGAYVELRPHDDGGARSQFTGIWTDLLYRQQAS